MNFPHWGVTPLPNSPVSTPSHPQFAHSAGQQCCGLSLLTVLTLIWRFSHKSLPPTGGSAFYFVQPGFSVRAVITLTLNVEETFYSQESPNKVTG